MAVAAGGRQKGGRAVVVRWLETLTLWIIAVTQPFSTLLFAGGEWTASSSPSLPISAHRRHPSILALSLLLSFFRFPLEPWSWLGRSPDVTVARRRPATALSSLSLTVCGGRGSGAGAAELLPPIVFSWRRMGVSAPCSIFFTFLLFINACSFN